MSSQDQPEDHSGVGDLPSGNSEEPSRQQPDARVVDHVFHNLSTSARSQMMNLVGNHLGPGAQVSPTMDPSSAQLSGAGQSLRDNLSGDQPVIILESSPARSGPSGFQRQRQQQSHSTPQSRRSRVRPPNAVRSTPSLDAPSSTDPATVPPPSDAGFPRAPYVCSYEHCGREYFAASSLWRHYREKHSDLTDNLYQCHICRYVFVRQYQSRTNYHKCFGRSARIGCRRMPTEVHQYNNAVAAAPFLEANSSSSTSPVLDSPPADSGPQGSRDNSAVAAATDPGQDNKPVASTSSNAQPAAVPPKKRKYSQETSDGPLERPTAIIAPMEPQAESHRSEFGDSSGFHNPNWTIPKSLATRRDVPPRATLRLTPIGRTNGTLIESSPSTSTSRQGLFTFVSHTAEIDLPASDESCLAIGVGVSSSSAHRADNNMPLGGDVNRAVVRSNSGVSLSEGDRDGNVWQRSQSSPGGGSFHTVGSQPQGVQSQVALPRGFHEVGGGQFESHPDEAEEIRAESLLLLERNEANVHGAASGGMRSRSPIVSTASSSSSSNGYDRGDYCRFYSDDERAGNPIAGTFGRKVGQVGEVSSSDFHKEPDRGTESSFGAAVVEMAETEDEESGEEILNQISTTPPVDAANEVRGQSSSSFFNEGAREDNSEDNGAENCDSECSSSVTVSPYPGYSGWRSSEDERGDFTSDDDDGMSVVDSVSPEELSELLRNDPLFCSTQSTSSATENGAQHSLCSSQSSN